MQNRPRRPLITAPGEGTNANVTTAVGIEETVGRRRARRTSLFSRTVMWVTGLICSAFLLGTLAQAWSNSNLIQQVQIEQSKLQQVKEHNAYLKKLEQQAKDPAVIEDQARQQLGYIRPGEHPVIVVRPPDKSEPQQQAARTVAAPQGFWQEWWNSFFGS